jgi:hypothetical protein
MRRRNEDMQGFETRLDEALGSEGHAVLRSLVGGLPDDEPSLAWRSQLNERLQHEAARRQTARKRAWVLRPAFGMALAGGLAAAVFLGAPAASGFDADIESGLLNAHREVALHSEVAGVGLRSYESQRAALDPAFDLWDDFDLGDL